MSRPLSHDPLMGAEEVRQLRWYRNLLRAQSDFYAAYEDLNEALDDAERKEELFAHIPIRIIRGPKVDSHYNEIRKLIEEGFEMHYDEMGFDLMLCGKKVNVREALLSASENYQIS